MIEKFLAIFERAYFSYSIASKGEKCNDTAMFSCFGLLEIIDSKEI